MPTILAAAGLPIPAQVQGLSVLPQLLDPEAGGPAREALFTEMTYHANYIPTRAVRTAEWKYIRNYSNIAFGGGDPGATEWAHRLLELPDQPWGRPRVEEELYNLVDDPQERTNLVSDASVRPALDRMRGLLHRQMAATKDPFLDAPFTNDYQPAARDTGARSTSSF
jgi:arylsulfatase A-like enzyme